ncbi:reticulata-related 5, chloroplastic-like protein, partial [Tanacetum coccineum]
MEAHALRTFHCHVDNNHRNLHAPELTQRVTRFTSNKRLRHVSINAVNNDNGEVRSSRRGVLVTPLIAIGAYALRSAVARADENTVPVTETVVKSSKVEVTSAKVEVKKEEVVTSRIYDASVIGEPMAVGKDKGKVWEKMMNGRIVYLGEAEQVPTRDDKDLEVEILKNLAKRCGEASRSITLALEAFSADLQPQLDQFVDK